MSTRTQTLVSRASLEHDNLEELLLASSIPRSCKVAAILLLLQMPLGSQRRD
jgi:hypothetical protein